MIKLTAGLDGPSARLVSATQAAQLADLLPAETAKNLHRSARAVRQALLAGEPDLASIILKTFGTTLADVESEQADVANIILVRVGAIVRVINFEQRQR